MRYRGRYLVPFLVLGVVSCKGADDQANAATAPAPAVAAPDFEAIANSVVNRTLGIKEGDVVIVSGSPRDLELLEDLVTNVEKVGGHPLLLMGTERMARRSYDDVPAKFDAVAGPWTKVLNSTATHAITVDAAETPDLLSHVDPARQTARTEANQAAADLYLARKIRTVALGNGMYPTHSRAAQFGMSRDQLASFFWSAMNADFTVLEANADHVIKAIGDAKELHITDPNGTDLRLTLTKKKWFVSDGIISDEDVRKGDFLAYLPAGEIYTRIDAGSAEGTIVASSYPQGGKNITNLKFIVSKGRVVSFDAPSGTEQLKKEYAAASKGADLVTVLDFGINPSLKASATAGLRTWVPEGMVTIAIGGDTWAGGTNTANYGFSPSLPNATVTADGRVIIENGQIKR